VSQITTKWITNNAVTLPKIQQIPATTLLGNNTGSTANVTALTVSQVQAMLSIPSPTSPLAVGSGGTGDTSFTAYAVIAGGTTSTGPLQSLGTGTSGQVLTSTGSSSLPTWQNPSSTDWQPPVEAYANSNVPLTGSTPIVIDGYTVANGNSVILGNQTTASQNGVYTAAISGGTYTLTATGYPTAAGDAYLVLNGTVYGYAAFVASAAVPAAEFVQFAGPTEYTFNAPLSAIGTSVSLNYGNGLTLSAGSLVANLSSTGALAFSGSQIAAQVDNSTIGINGSNQLYVLPSGITSTQLASASVTAAKLATVTDGVTTNQLGSGSTIESLRPTAVPYTLTSTDISNQFIDLDTANGFPSNDPAYGSSNSVNSVSMSVVGGPEQQIGVDFTVSLTGGSGGSTRVTFAGNLATGGNSALASGDILIMAYSYL
jgi:hypothetical protein